MKKVIAWIIISLVYICIFWIMPITMDGLGATWVIRVAIYHAINITVLAVTGLVAWAIYTVGKK